MEETNRSTVCPLLLPCHCDTCIKGPCKYLEKGSAILIALRFHHGYIK